MILCIVDLKYTFNLMYIFLPLMFWETKVKGRESVPLLHY